jgi:predicted PurR-regulated permease PerM
MLVQQLVDNLIAPRIMGDRIGVHPVAIIFAVLAGGKLLGVFGMVLAVPAAALLKVVGAHFLQRYHASSLYGSDAVPTAPVAVDPTPPAATPEEREQP